MKKILMTVIIMAAAVCAYADGFRVYLPDVGKVFSNAQVFNGFGCSGDNTAPTVKWENPPKGAESFALTMYDPDAPTGSGWWHWIVTDIPAGAKAIAGGKLPEGAVDMNTDFGQPGYGGPCPPVGQNHRYIITLHALKVKNLGVPAQASGAMTGFMINANTIEKTSVTVRYGR
ncbi:MAG: YbhB/YbcL family Raf kinase inhibitor-like protein [Deferribacterales bacterium]